MDKQYSKQFFSSFLSALQEVCRMYVDFVESVDISGYLAVEVDGRHRERYVLAELIHASGNIMSESLCVKAYKTITPSNRPTAEPRYCTKRGHKDHADLQIQAVVPPKMPCPSKNKTDYLYGGCSVDRSKSQKPNSRTKSRDSSPVQNLLKSLRHHSTCLNSDDFQVSDMVTESGELQSKRYSEGSVSSDAGSRQIYTNEVWRTSDGSCKRHHLKETYKMTQYDEYDCPSPYGHHGLRSSESLDCLLKKNLESPTYEKSTEDETAVVPSTSDSKQPSSNVDDVRLVSEMQRGSSDLNKTTCRELQNKCARIKITPMKPQTGSKSKTTTDWKDSPKADHGFHDSSSTLNMDASLLKRSLSKNQRLGCDQQSILSRKSLLCVQQLENGDAVELDHAGQDLELDHVGQDMAPDCLDQDIDTVPVESSSQSGNQTADNSVQDLKLTGGISRDKGIHYKFTSDKDPSYVSEKDHSKTVNRKGCDHTKRDFFKIQLKNLEPFQDQSKKVNILCQSEKNDNSLEVDSSIKPYRESMHKYLGQAGEKTVPYLLDQCALSDENNSVDIKIKKEICDIKSEVDLQEVMSDNDEDERDNENTGDGCEEQQTSTHPYLDCIDGNLNTARKTRYHMNLLTKHLLTWNEKRPIEDLPCQELDTFLSTFFATVKKENGEDYGMGSLSSIQSSIDRYLRKAQYPYSIKHNSLFSHSRNVLEARQRLMRNKLEKKIRRPALITEEEVKILYEKGQLGTETPDALLNTAWFLNNVHFGLRSSMEHYSLRWGNFSLKEDSRGKEYLEMRRKKPDGEEVILSVPSLEANPSRCCVSVYKKFRSVRPDETCQEDSPFYLTVNLYRRDTLLWFRAQNMGYNKFGSVLRKMAAAAGLDTQKFTSTAVELEQEEKGKSK